ncbi:hypothetical protein [Roseimicrobium sp. ORNL1]|uniref:hypothetical protein n=1 Tax=Roseimicrobium sp. ORNL1 TaxID=2711231 RepID=UPI0013E12F50|nr:hypothetical protein [Roseimicrobium sp. ORNL1]QIF01950.1 hypothetical protein G5S37_10555 [Roseimicrobium sp. ORNL1]
MSRRTKLIITTLFLVLLAIPAVHFYFHWRPENPLRFQIGNAGAGFPLNPHDLRVPVIVRNSSATPIHLQFAIIATKKKEQVGAILPPVWLGSKTYDEVVPPYGTLEMYCSERNFIADARAPGYLQVAYIWDSNLRYRAKSLYGDLGYRISQWLSLDLPYISPESDTAPLEIDTGK